MLDLIGLLNLDGYPHGVDARLDQNTFVLVTGDGEGGQEDLGGGLGLNLGDIVTFGGLGSEVGEREGGRQTAPDGLEVGSQGLRLSESR